MGRRRCYRVRNRIMDGSNLYLAQGRAISYLVCASQGLAAGQVFNSVKSGEAFAAVLERLGVAEMLKPKTLRTAPLNIFEPALTGKGNDMAAGAMKLPRFRGHRTVCLQGVHDGQDKSGTGARRPYAGRGSSNRRHSRSGTGLRRLAQYGAWRRRPCHRAQRNPSATLFVSPPPNPSRTGVPAAWKGM
jgi:hypothetical protein